MPNIYQTMKSTPPVAKAPAKPVAGPHIANGPCPHCGQTAPAAGLVGTVAKASVMGKDKDRDKSSLA